MSIKHVWSITQVFGHPLNPDCIFKISTTLTSSNGDQSIDTEHDFYLAPNVGSEDSEDPDYDSNVIIWVDTLDDFIPVKYLTERAIWRWIDKNEDRAGFETENAEALKPLVEDPEPVPLTLSFMS